ncbi:MAG TPA: cob(I)yrinic acid a,c-diamide adenosyltransferase, partial [Tepidisphaeraceae bacterium]|nr:cob(I)yrinic acid a,c-diamide adenosyltransferase [Tepidisphaeraceae bacterium]
RIECVGTIDELNASLGWSAVVASQPLLAHLRQIQNDLFVLGSHLALPDQQAPKNQWLPTLDDSIITRLEMQIDTAEQSLAPLRNFILPGGCELAARLHLTRTICRRAERLLVSFSLDRPIPEIMVTYINRLSDWLFVQARLANHTAQVADIPWEKT